MDEIVKELLADLRSSEDEMSLEIPEIALDWFDQMSSTPEGKSVELAITCFVLELNYREMGEWRILRGTN